MEKNFPSLTDHEPKTGPSMTDDTITKAISMSLNQPTMIWSLPPTVCLEVAMVDTFAPSPSFQRITGGQASPPISRNMFLDVQFAKHTKFSSIL